MVPDHMLDIQNGNDTFDDVMVAEESTKPDPDGMFI